MDQIIERKILNFEVEDAFINTAKAATAVMSYSQTERGQAPIDLFEQFHSSFYYLTILTSDLKQLSQNQEDVDRALSWLKDKIGKNSEDSMIMRKLEEGIIIFRNYKKVLSEQGVVALPSK